MKITKQRAIEIWGPILERLRNDRTEYNYKSVLEMSGGIRRGYSAEDMLEELKFVIENYEKRGLIQRMVSKNIKHSRCFGIDFEDSDFYFTDNYTINLRKNIEKIDKKRKVQYLISLIKKHWWTLIPVIAAWLLGRYCG